MFQQHYLENRKPTFFACDSKQAYASILESLKNNNLFQNREIYSRLILEIPRNFLDMVSVKLQI